MLIVSVEYTWVSTLPSSALYAHRKFSIIFQNVVFQLHAHKLKSALIWYHTFSCRKCLCWFDNICSNGNIYFGSHFEKLLHVLQTSDILPNDFKIIFMLFMLLYVSKNVG